MQKYQRHIEKLPLDELKKGSEIYVVADIDKEETDSLSLIAYCFSVDEKRWGTKLTRTLHFKIPNDSALKFDWIGERKTASFDIKIEIDETDPDFPKLITKNDSSRYGASPVRSTFGYSIFYATTDEEELETYLTIFFPYAEERFKICNITDDDAK